MQREPESPDAEFAARLEACEASLNAGDESGSSLLPGLAESDAMRQRVERGLACVKRLKKQWPGRLSGGGGAPGQPAWGEMPASIGRFQIRRELGRGAYGVVFLAHDPVLGREIALKLPRVDVLLEPDLRDRFAQEARAAAALDHPHIVQVYEAGQIGPICYIASAYCPGETLAEWLRRQQDPVPPAEAAGLVATLAAAVEHAHGKGVLHRDIKPGNVLLQLDGGSLASATLDQFAPKITDFGLAKVQTSDLAQTHTGSVLGTPSYMAPEQACGKTKQITAAADVYALGAILYELLTGRPPFQGDSAWDTLQQVQTQEAVAPSKLRWKAPRDLETICLKCLEKEPARRYAAARDLADDLRRFVNGQTIRARPATRREQAVKWAKRKPVIAGLLAGLVLVTALGFSGITWQWLRADRALDELTEAYNQKAAVVVQRETALAEKDAALADKVLALAEKEQQRAAAETNLYSHLVASAHQEWLASNPLGATELLDQCPPSKRHWEWNYVQRLCRTELLTLSGHRQTILAAAVSADGRRIATAAGLWGSEQPAEVKLWDSGTGAELFTLAMPLPVYQLTFNADATQLLTASGRGLQFWDVATRHELRPLREPTGAVAAVCFSPDGRTLAVGGGNGHLTLWDTAGGEKWHDLAGHQQLILSVAISPDGSRVATSSRDGTARLWDRESGKSLHVLSGPNDVRCVAFSPDGSLLATVSYDHTAKIWDVASGEQRLLYTKHDNPLLVVSFTPDGQSVATGDSLGHVRFWSPLDGRDRFTLHAHSGAVSSLRFVTGGRLFVTAGADRTAKLWDIDGGQQHRRITSRGAAGPSLAATSDNRRVAYAQGIQIGLQDLTVDDQSPPELLGGHRDAVTAVEISDDDALLVSASQDRTIRVWGLQPETHIARSEPLQTAAAGAFARADEPPRFRRELRGHEGGVTDVVFEPRSHRLASGGRDNTVRIWDADEGVLLQTLRGHTAGVLQVAVCPDARHLASTDLAGALILWDRAQGTEIVRAPGGGLAGVRGLAFSPDGRWLAAADREHVVRVWDVAGLISAARSAEPNHGAALLTSLTGHTSAVTALAFSPDGRRLASASYDWTIRLWDLPSGCPLLSLNAGGHVADACFTSDGTSLLGITAQLLQWDARLPTADANAERRRAIVRELPDWHRRQANQCLEAKLWAPAVFHFNHLLGAGVDDADLFRRRGHAHAQLGNQTAAAVDSLRANGLQANGFQAARYFALAALRSGDRADYERAAQRSAAALGDAAGRTVVEVAAAIGGHAGASSSQDRDATPATRKAVEKPLKNHE